MLISVAVFAIAAAAIFAVGPRMARTADQLSEVTRLGGALFGVVFLALATDLPEIALTPSAVLGGRPRLAVGGLLGAATVQLVLIAVVDLVLRKRKLYREVRRRNAMVSGWLMLAVLAVPITAMAVNVSFLRVSAATLVLPVVYFGGLEYLRRTRQDRDVGPDVDTPEKSDPAAPVDEHSTSSLWAWFGLFAVVLAGAGVALEQSTDAIGTHLGISNTAAGALLAGMATPLPELVTAVSAARGGAVTMAFGNLVGSSALDVMLLSWADVFYADGTVFDLIRVPEAALLAGSTAVTVVALAGVRRAASRDDRAIGFESYLILALYAIVVGVLLASG